MISILKHDKPNLPICKMNCDEPLSKKLNKYELTKFLNTHTTNLILGKPGSGKSSLLYSLFKGKLLSKVFHNIYLFRPDKSGMSMKDDIYAKLPDTNKFNELSYANLDSVINRMRADDDGLANCIIFDDMGAFLKNADIQKLFKELIMDRRHMHCSIYFLCQTFYSVPREIRKLFSNIFIFKC